MATIFKISGYLVDPNDDFTAEDLKVHIKESYDLISHNIEVEEADLGEWDDDNPLNDLDCPINECEKYFDKKFLGNKSSFNEVFKKWIPEEPTEVKKKEEISVEKMRAKLFRFCEGDPGCGECDLRKFCEKNNHDFLSRYHGEYVVSDDKIREAYNIVFGIKNEM